MCGSWRMTVGKATPSADELLNLLWIHRLAMSGFWRAISISVRLAGRVGDSSTDMGDSLRSRGSKPSRRYTLHRRTETTTRSSRLSDTVRFGFMGGDDRTLRPHQDEVTVAFNPKTKNFSMNRFFDLRSILEAQRPLKKAGLWLGTLSGSSSLRGQWIICSTAFRLKAKRKANGQTARCWLGG